MAEVVNSKTGQNLKDAIIDLYLNIKIRSNDEIAQFNEEKYDAERIKLCETDLFVVLDYIRTTVEILMNIKEEEKEQHSSRSVDTIRDIPKEYEQALQKLEEEARNHVRVEQQLKLHIESLQFKQDDMEKALQKAQSLEEESKKEIIKLQEEIGGEKKEARKLKAELVQTKEAYKQIQEKYLTFTHTSGQNFSQMLQYSEDGFEQKKKRSETASPDFLAEKKKVLQASSEAKHKLLPADKSSSFSLIKQNIYQIICKSPEQIKERSPYIMEFKHHEKKQKGKELHRLKQKLSNIQTEIRSKRTVSRESSVRSRRCPGFASTMAPESIHSRCKSQKSTTQSRAREEETLLNRSQFAYTSKIPLKYFKSSVRRSKCDSTSLNDSIHKGDFSIQF